MTFLYAHLLKTKSVNQNPANTLRDNAALPVKWSSFSTMTRSLSSLSSEPINEAVAGKVGFPIAESDRNTSIEPKGPRPSEDRIIAYVWQLPLAVATGISAHGSYIRSPVKSGSQAHNACGLMRHRISTATESLDWASDNTVQGSLFGAARVSSLILLRCISTRN